MFHVPRALRRFRRDERGGVALMLALSLIPLSGAALAAVDLTRGLSAKSQLQDALDAAALAASKATAKDGAVLQSVGHRELQQNVADVGSTLTLADDTFQFDKNYTVLADAHATVSTILAGRILSLLGGPQTGDPTELTVAAHSEVLRGNMKLEVAMVLDNTGSMDEVTDTGQTKIATLKTAALRFVDILKAAAASQPDADALKISLVPFSQTVRVDPNAYKNATWIDLAGASDSAKEIFSDGKKRRRLDIAGAIGSSWMGCLEMRRADDDINETAPNNPQRRYVPYFAPDGPDTDPNDYQANKTALNNNDYLRDQTSGTQMARETYGPKYDNPQRSPYGSLGDQFGPNKGCTLQPLIRLGTDLAPLTAAINNMRAQGDTNIPFGLMWGWHTLSPKAPFADGVAYNKDKYAKVVLLMTDGQNKFTVQNDFNGSLYEAQGFIWQGRFKNPDGTKLTSGTDAQRGAAMDDRLVKLCTNMKAKNVGIEIYTVAVQGKVRYDTTALQQCASGPEYFYDVNASGLTQAFESIASQIAKLHLSR